MTRTSWYSTGVVLIESLSDVKMIEKSKQRAGTVLAEPAVAALTFITIGSLSLDLPTAGFPASFGE